MTLSGLERRRWPRPGIGAADYSDDTMLQCLRDGAHRARRIQTKGYRLVELVRIYEVAGGDQDATKG